MRNNHKTYCVFLDVASHPQMYGIRGTNGICVGRISTCLLYTSDAADE